MNDVVEAIDTYLGYGWALVPIRPDSKIPYVRWSRTSIPETPPARKVYEWFERFDDAHIGILTGKRSGGLIAVDVDPRNGGTVPTDLPPTMTASTPSGGVHLLFHSPNRTNASPGLIGVDVRGEGGLIVAPPAPGRSWTSTSNIAQLPDSWGRRARGRPATGVNEPAVKDVAVATALLERYARDVVDEPDGGRNTKLYGRTKDAVRRLSTHLGVDTIMSQMYDAGIRAGLAPSEITKTIASAYRSQKDG